MLSSMADNLAENKRKARGQVIRYWIDVNKENMGLITRDKPDDDDGGIGETLEVA